MKFAPIPKDEEERLSALHALRLLDTPPEGRFDRITLVATKLFHVPISTLTLVDRDREWFKSCQGLPKNFGDRAISFCGHALMESEILVVPDTTKDERFFDNPMVVSEPFIRFYAGVPVKSIDGKRIGVFCVKDTLPREFSRDDEIALEGLASWAQAEVNFYDICKVLRRKMERAEEDVASGLKNLQIEKKRLEVDMARDEAILQNIGDGLIVTDKNRKIILVNKAFENLTGFLGQEVVGKSFSTFMQGEIEGESVATVSSLENILGRILKGENVRSDGRLPNVHAFGASPCTYLVRKNQARLAVSGILAPIVIGKTIIGAVEIFRDITKEKEIDKQKTEFVSLVSHQLRTPLTSISWNAEMILHGETGKITPDQKRYLEEIYRGNGRMIELVDSLLDVSRIELGTLSANPEQIDPLVLAGDVLSEQNAMIREKNLHVRTQFDADVPIFSLDPKFFRMVIQNIFANAVKYTPAGGAIAFSVSLESSTSVMICVQDTGYGIPREQQGRIFTKFFRADNVKDNETEGTGLGLYIAKSVVENSGGKIWFSSPAKSPLGGETSENPGSIFCVVLPMIKRQKRTSR